MLSSAILDVAIGVIFVFVLVSLLCSAVREGLEAWMKTRAAYLEYGIRELLRDPKGNGLTAQLFNHPMISGLYSGDYRPGRSDRRPGWLEEGDNLPSYIPAKNFALALIDLAARGPRLDVDSGGQAPFLSLAGLRANVQLLENPAVQRVLLMAIDSAQGDLDTVRTNIEAWYDSAMDRVGGWYKRSTQWVILWIALAVTIAGNINTLVIANYLHRNDGARAVLVERAKVATNDATVLDKNYKETQALLDELKLPIGWDSGILAYKAGRAEALANPAQGAKGAQGLALVTDAMVVVFGWLLTAFAATLGAPFWFDVLKRVMSIRATLKGDVGAEPAPPPGPAPSARPAIVVAPAAAVATSLSLDVESQRDCCEERVLEAWEETQDQALPQATGGVAG